MKVLISRRQEGLREKRQCEDDGSTEREIGRCCADGFKMEDGARSQEMQETSRS